MKYWYFTPVVKSTHKKLEGPLCVCYSILYFYFFIFIFREYLAFCYLHIFIFIIVTISETLVNISLCIVGF